MPYGMIINWPIFIVTLLILAFPPSLMISAGTKRRLSHEREAGDFRIGRGLLAWQNWVDLARGYGGCYLLFEYALIPPEDQGWMLLVWSAGILAAALLVQTVRRYHGRSYFLAPIFFTWGITFYLAGPLLTFYGIAVATLLATVSKNAEWHLPTLAAVVGAVGYLTIGIKLTIVVVVALAVWPLVVTFCGRGHMVFLMRPAAVGERVR